MSAGVSTDVERCTCPARREGRGLTEEWRDGGVAERIQRDGGRRRGKSGRWSALPRGTSVALQE
jgi:hypothetical protein